MHLFYNKKICTFESRKILYENCINLIRSEVAPYCQISFSESSYFALLTLIDLYCLTNNCRFQSLLYCFTNTCRFQTSLSLPYKYMSIYVALPTIADLLCLTLTSRFTACHSPITTFATFFLIKQTPFSTVTSFIIYKYQIRADFVNVNVFYPHRILILFIYSLQ